MWPGKHAVERPDHPAYVMAESGTVVTYRELNDRSNQLAQLFYDAGLRFGDHVAIFMENRPEFFEVCWAAQRSGLFYTAINSHFNADEVAYIVDDCDAQVLVVSDSMRDVAIGLVDKMPNVKIRLACGDSVDGFEPYEAARDRYPAAPLDEELEGTRMLYSSGTTGRPKGVKYRITRQRVGEQPVEMGMMTTVWGMDADAVYLSP
ncbi:MAG TPA: AMP-binding protein, partial [Acidimicrobiia bacterium]|nr:AMP-binding protein [Acidimicrobiia bacterium]